MIEFRYYFLNMYGMLASIPQGQGRFPNRPYIAEKDL